MSFSCKNCGSPLVFDIKTQRLKCENCGSSYETMGKFEPDKYSVQHCLSCGGEFVSHGNSNIVSMICPFCGSSILNESALNVDFKPNYIVPFQVTKEKAMELYKNQCNDKYLAPDDFTKESKIESIQGLYVPFWLFDYDVYGEADVQVKIGEKLKLDHYLFHTTIDSLPVDGSSWIENELMESIEPFDFSDVKEYNPLYLLGFYSEKYDDDISVCEKNAKQRALNTCRQKFSEKYATIQDIVIENTTFKNQKLALIPVWIISTKYGDMVYQFVVNGQSGVCSGDLPMDKRKKCFLFLEYFIGFSILGTLISILFF